MNNFFPRICKQKELNKKKNEEKNRKEEEEKEQTWIFNSTKWCA